MAEWEGGGGKGEQDENRGLRGLIITARAEIVDPGDSGRFPVYYDEYRQIIHRDVPPEDQLPPMVKLIRVVPDVIELFDPSLKGKGYSAKQIWRR